jgi:hypothetical protein
VAYKDFAVGEILTSSDVDTYLMSQVIIRCTSGTRPASPALGWHIYETDTKRFLVYNGTSWVPEGGETLTAIKSADETVTNSTSLQDDNHLFLSVAANAVYKLDLCLFYDGPTNADLKMTWTVPSGTGMTWGIDTVDPSATTSTPFPISRGVNTSPTTQMVLGTPTDGSGWWVNGLISGVLRVGGTAGTLQLRWAQNTANAIATTVHTDSTLELRRLS